MKKIIISVTNDLTTDQRVEKVCNSLLKLNYTILLIGRKHPHSTPINRPYQTIRFTLLFNKGILFYAEYNIRLFFKLLFTKKELLLSNDLDTLPANFLISKVQQKKLIYDSHELFSESPELINKPIIKKVWQSLENMLLPKIKNSYTVSKSIAEHYNSKYRTNFKIVRNLPQKKKHTKAPLPLNTEGKKIILYQGVVNIGRGLELIIDTIPFLKNHLFLIVGDGDILKILQQKVARKNLQKKVIFLGKKTPIELQKITPNADIGISLEEDLGLNYRYALPNKLFDYIQAEIPVLTSDLPEMKQIVSQYQIGKIVTDRTPKKLATIIESFCPKEYTHALKKAKEQLIWANEETVLYDVFKNLK
ncbi:glycosyltransferase [Tenacibaculum maritimum]|uniref:glycosyltransferase n=1 Tax=Tenacibaculum maritimum TaxID=107401 RepID=UPI0010A3C42D|nr:glycosyltransferase [Tenacibaculum maritimum]MCD9581483.1 glycosyltransferase [Tenacibaculum maritimum]MCD9585155.1 glycosyltransferase [Tenacibaculum maritimum]MCD9611179.1 glycosyltransferase [Tenacibaculum maritimum]MCD9620753.1 glycosyltransferase [Tenacibaculum maritimum]MCD9627495.1 glycosyltransferase [Tenacibaculum maritimum]